MVKQIFVNLPVKDLKKTMEFFGKLGFSFNPQFTDDKAASLVIGENIYAMLVTEKFFQTFTKKAIADATKSTEVLLAISVESREKVDEMVNTALKSGGSKANEVSDYGWMYSWSFQDLDGHIWEVLYIDEKNIPANPAASTKQ